VVMVVAEAAEAAEVAVVAVASASAVEAAAVVDARDAAWAGGGFTAWGAPQVSVAAYPGEVAATASKIRKRYDKPIFGFARFRRGCGVVMLNNTFKNITVLSRRLEALTYGVP
jgi:hypothetical protein